MSMMMKLALLMICNIAMTFVLSSAPAIRETARSPRSNAAANATPRWGFQRSGPQWYSGGLLGVGADVLLDRERLVAHITLKGPVFPGAVSGVARFSDSNTRETLGGEVVIGEPLKSVLKHRFVSIGKAYYDSARDTVVVQVRLPMGLGKHTITLNRV